MEPSSSQPTPLERRIGSWHVLSDRTRADGLRTVCVTLYKYATRTSDASAHWLAAWNTDKKVFQGRRRSDVVRKAMEYREQWGQGEDVFDALRRLA